jgi:hypothetical protein
VRVGLLTSSVLMHTSAGLVVQDVGGVSDFAAEHLVQFGASYDSVIHASLTLACLALPRTKFKLGVINV